MKCANNVVNNTTSNVTSYSFLRKLLWDLKWLKNQTYCRSDGCAMLTSFGSKMVSKLCLTKDGVVFGQRLEEFKIKII